MTYCMTDELTVINNDVKYQIRLPKSLLEQLKKLAKKRKTTVSRIFRYGAELVLAEKR